MKHMFTPGPASIHPDSLKIQPCFGRGDEAYLDIEAQVIELIKGLCKQEHVVPLQGSATLALEIAARNFLHGRVLVVDTGYYSRRLYTIAQSCSAITHLDVSTLNTSQKNNYDWIVGCPVETGLGYYTPIHYFKDIDPSAKLFVDATGSIGLEQGHEHADVMAFSGCKGLFGLTGAAFVAYSEAEPRGNSSYYLDLNTHINRGVTGPYHAIQSLLPVLQNHNSLFESVKINKHCAVELFSEYLIFPATKQPYLSTALSCEITAANSNVVLYQPREIGNATSVICHLGELYLGADARGNILNQLIYKDIASSG